MDKNRGMTVRQRVGEQVCQRGGVGAAHDVRIVAEHREDRDVSAERPDAASDGINGLRLRLLVQSVDPDEQVACGTYLPPLTGISSCRLPSRPGTPAAVPRCGRNRSAPGGR
jgi:hypothetical protein